MTDDEKQKLWLTLGSIEASQAETTRHLGSLDETVKELDDKIDVISVERAEERGAQKAAGRWAGMWSGGMISGIIIGVKALFDN